jgi:hypothetical protein
LRASNVVPALIPDLGDEAGWRYVEFVTANIGNPHTRRVIPGLQPVFLLLQAARPDARYDPPTMSPLIT